MVYIKISLLSATCYCLFAKMSNPEEKEIARRSLRSKKLSLKAIESAYMKKLKALQLVKLEDESDSASDSDYEPSDLCVKPSIINTRNTVEGEKIFSFQKRMTRDSLAQKVSQARELMPKTPHHVRSKIRNQIATNMLDSSSENPFSDSGSEYIASDSSDSTESESADEITADDTESEDSGSQAVITKKVKLGARSKLAGTSSASGVQNRKHNKKYFIKTDDYFESHATKKILTSNHTLDKLETPRLPQDQLRTLLEKMKLTTEHEKCVKELNRSAENCYSKWLYLMQENFNILLYGLGCKRHILNEFHSHCLQDYPVIVVNGFFPTVIIKDILDGIIVDLLELKENPANPYDACDLIEQNLLDQHLYLIVHNIEGDMLRGKKSQDVLARLASMKTVHLIASIDHINAPLIWDHAKLSKFNYSWWDVTSFVPYIEETSFESSLLVQGAGTLALSSLRNVFLSLTTNSKGIYMIIVKHQLENAKSQYYPGLAFKELYAACREAFLVSSDLALRAQLNEFVDHKMVKYKRSADGTEYLIIPIANGLLKKFTDEQPG